MLCRGTQASSGGNNNNDTCEPIVRRSKQTYRDPCEQETTEWVEQEVMARVLSEMYPRNKWQKSEAVRKESRGLTEERSLPFTMDPGVALPKSSLEKLIDEELRDIIRHMISGIRAL